MRILNSLVLLLTVVFVMSCEENEITYDTKSVEGDAQFQLHYDVPVTAVQANDIYKIEINGTVFTNETAKLSTYGITPNPAVAVGRFYAVEPGNVNIKMYQGVNQVLVYDQTTQLAAGKQNVFVHDFNQPPVVIDHEYPYPSNVTEDTDSATWVQFYNFLYETAGVPTTLRLQYQYLDPYTDEPINLGAPVRFGEATGWQEVRVVKDILNSSGSTRIDYRIKVVDDGGNIVGDLQVRNSGGNMVNYSDWWTGFIGRKVYHIYAGIRTAAPIAGVRQFYAE